LSLFKRYTMFLQVCDCLFSASPLKPHDVSVPDCAALSFMPGGRIKIKNSYILTPRHFFRNFCPSPIVYHMFTAGETRPLRPFRRDRRDFDDTQKVISSADIVRHCGHRVGGLACDFAVAGGGAQGFTRLRRCAAGSQKATFAAGCFWSMQAIFQQLEGGRVHRSPATRAGHDAQSYLRGGGVGFDRHAETIRYHLQSSGDLIPGSYCRCC